MSRSVFTQLSELPVSIDLNKIHKYYDFQWEDAGTTKKALRLMEQGQMGVYLRGLMKLEAVDVNRIVELLKAQNEKKGKKTLALAFKHQHMDEEGLTSLGNFLADNTNCSLVYLDLQCNFRVNIDHSSPWFESVIVGLTSNRTITDINLGKNDINVKGAQRISRLLERNRTLQGLNLKETKLTLTGVISVLNAIQVNETLVYLNLDENQIGDTGCNHVANTLQTNSSLRIISLQRNKISSEGATYLAEALKTNRSLKRLSLQSNVIDDVGGRAFIDSFLLTSSIATLEYAEQSKKTLREVYASRNRKTDAEYVNKFLEQLDISLNRLKSSTERQIQAMLQKQFRTVFEFKNGSMFWSDSAWSLIETSKGIHVVETAIRLLDANEIKLFHKTVTTKNRKNNQTMSEALLRNARDGEITGLITLLIDVGKFDMDQLETSGRSHREAAEHHRNGKVRMWAKALNAFDGKYVIEEGAPTHRSATCDVFYATETFSNRKVALKITKERDAFELEYEIRNLLGKGVSTKYNQCILDYAYKSEDTSDKMYFEFERADRSLFDVINNERLSGIDMKNVRAIAKQAATALEFVHSKGLIHGDFKPRNFLRIDYEMNIWKLIDFDAAVRIGDPVSGKKHSSAYAPPEMVLYLYRGNRKISPPVAKGSFDVWSFGVLLYELLSGTPLFLSSKTDDHLFSTRAKAEVINWLEIDDERLDRILANCSIGEKYAEAAAISAGKDLVKRCLAGEESNRPTFSQILKHPFFREGNENSRMFLEDPASRQTHFFLSYMQRQAAGTVKDVYNITRAIGATSWLDMEVNDLTVSGMRAGVLNARAMILVLNRDTLSSPYVILELMWAIDMKKDVIFCVEVDQREGLYPFEKEIFKKTWDDKNKLKEMASDICSIANLGKLQFTGVLANVISKQKKSREGDEDLVLKMLQKEVRPEIEKYVEEKNMVPYRRRKYETSAMIDYLMERIGFIPPSTLQEEKMKEAHWYLNLLSRTKIVVLVPPQDDSETNFTKTILRGITEYLYLQDYETQWVEISSDEEIKDEDDLLTSPVVLLSIITPRIFEGKHGQNFEKLKSKSRVLLHDNFFEHPKSLQDQILKGKFSETLSQTELMPFRAPEPRQYEYKAMLKEIARRITRFGLSLEID